MTNWPTKKLGKVCEIIAGQAPPSKFYNKEGKGKPFIRVNSFGETFPKIDTWTTSSLKESREGDVLLSVAGTIGEVNFGINASITRSVFALRPNDRILQHYLYYYLKTKQKFLGVRATGSSQKIITINFLKNLEISLPPVKNQKQIVGRLDKIVEVRKLNGELIQKAEELFRSLLHKELDPIGKNWETKRVKDILSREKYSVEKLKRQEYQKFGTYPIIDQSINGIAGYSENKELVYSGKLPLVIYGDHTRIIKFVDKPFILGADGTKILIPQDEVLANYLYFVLHLYNVAGQGYKRHFSLLKEIKIPVPPLKIQKQIVAKFSAVQDYKKQLIKQKTKLKELFDSVLSKSFSGQL